MDKQNPCGSHSYLEVDTVYPSHQQRSNLPIRQHGLLYNFLRAQLFVKLPYPTSDFSGQIIIVTGSNTCLGLEAGRHIDRLWAIKVRLVCRMISKGETTAEDFTKSEQPTEDITEVWQIGLADF